MALRSIFCGTLFTTVFALGCSGTQTRPLAASDGVTVVTHPAATEQTGTPQGGGSATAETGEHSVNGDAARRLFDLLASADADRRPSSDPNEMIMDHLSCDAAWSSCTFETIDGNDLRNVPPSVSRKMRALLLEEGLTPDLLPSAKVLRAARVVHLNVSGTRQGRDLAQQNQDC